MNSKLIIACALLLTGCATARTKYSDKDLRVMIDPESIDYHQQVALQSELVKTRKFVVVDRNAGFRAIKQEQYSAYRSEADRYADGEKFAHYGELYGVGAVIVAHVVCKEAAHWYNVQSYYVECHQYLSMVDASSGEVFLAVDKKVSGDRGEVASWEDIVRDLVEQYPEYFHDHKLHDRLIQYKKDTAKLARAQRGAPEDKDPEVQEEAE
jgi:hypothetical protein